MTFKKYAAAVLACTLTGFLLVSPPAHAVDGPSFRPPCLSGTASDDGDCLDLLRENKGAGGGAGSSAYTAEKLCREKVPCTLEVIEDRKGRIACLLKACCTSGTEEENQKCAEAVADSTQAYTAQKQCRNDKDCTIEKQGDSDKAKECIIASCCTDGSDYVRGVCATAVLASDPSNSGGGGGSSYTAEKECRDSKPCTIAKYGDQDKARECIYTGCCTDGTEEERQSCTDAVWQDDPDYK